MSPKAQAAVIVAAAQQSVRSVVSDYLKGQAFQVWTAGSAEEALALLERHKIAVMLCDLRLPGSASDFITKAIGSEPDLAVVMLTLAPDATTATLCMQRGAMDYLILPLALEDLGRAVRRALKRRKLLVLTRTLESRRKQYELERMAVATLEAMVLALEAKDPYLRGHSARVAELAAAIAAAVGLPEEDVEHVRIAGRLHDIGEVGTRESVLDKRGPLTADERDHVEQHVVIGSQILALLSPLGVVSSYVRSHHERWDGSGYPDGLRGEDIPIGARIIGAVEIYDALSTPRPYQGRLSPQDAVERLRQLSGTALDPKVCDAFPKVIAQRVAFPADEDAVVSRREASLNPSDGPTT